MATEHVMYWRNHDSSDNTYVDHATSTMIVVSPESLGFSAPEGKIFDSWNTQRDGSGIRVEVGVVGDKTTLYGIWVNADVVVTYNSSAIAGLGATGSKTLNTAGKYCSGSVIVSYTKPALQSKTVTPTTSVQNVTPDSSVYGLSQVTVDAIPSAYIIPSGTITLSSSGTFDVGSYASAEVTVTGGPSGTYIDWTSSNMAMVNIGDGSEFSTLFCAGVRDIYSITGISSTNLSASGASWCFFSAGIRCSLSFPYNSTGQGSYSYWFKQAYIYSDITFTEVQTLRTCSEMFYGIRHPGLNDVTISFPKLNLVNYGDNVFGLITDPTIVFSFPMLKSVTNTSSFFYKAWYWDGSWFPELETLSSTNYAFADGIYLSYASFSKLKYVRGDYAFFGLRSAVSASFPELSYISGSYFLGSCPELTTAYMPKLETWFSGGFNSSTSKLQYVDFPLLSSLSLAYMGYMAVGSASYLSLPALTTYDQQNGGALCRSGPYLKSVYLPSLTLLRSAAFNGCYGLSSISLPALTSMYSDLTFGGCSALEYIDISTLTLISGKSTFTGCSKMSWFSFPNLETISGTYTFSACSSLTSARLPKYSYNVATGNMFDGCWSLSLVKFDIASRLSGAYMFRNCRKLVSLFLLGSSVCALGNTVASMFISTPVSTYSTSAGRWASIFVPSSLLASYKAATNWTVVSSKIFAYEDYFATS